MDHLKRLIYRITGAEGSPRRGMSLVEVMIAVVILSIGVLAFIGSFASMSKAIQKAKTRTLSATPLTMEKLEVLKKVSYSRLMVSTATTSAAEAGLDGFEYDTAAYPEETVTIGDISFIRRVLIEKVQQAGDDFAPVDGTSADTGIKRITAYTIWKEDGEWKKYQATSLYSNVDHSALSTTIKGKVKDENGAELENVQIVTLQSASFSDITNATGDYEFYVTAGSYTVRASKRGYYSSYSSKLSANTGSVHTVDFADGEDAPPLVKIGTGTVTGSVYVSTHLVISQIVLATHTSLGCNATNYDIEYIELFNPTTYPINIGDGAVSDVLVDYDNETGEGQDKDNADFAWVYVSSYVEPGKYYLFASTGSFCMNEQPIYADAHYGVGNSDYLTEKNAGCITITDAADSSVLDTVGWCDDTADASYPYCKAPTDCYETAPIPDSPGFDGIDAGNQVVRLSSPSWRSDTYGKAYDTDHNRWNFVFPGLDWSGIDTLPRNTTDAAQTVVAGRPAYDAIVTADDGLSIATQAVTVNKSTAAEEAEFTLTNVATGTYTVYISLGEYHQEIEDVVVTQGATTYVPNAATDPTWPAVDFYSAKLTTMTTKGFITGTVTDGDLVALEDIVLSAAGTTATTGSSGEYVLSLATGTVTVAANPSSDAGYDGNYVSASSGGWNVQTGQITAGVDFSLSKGGSLIGWITINGHDPLGNVPVIATQNDLERGSAQTDATGYFTISNLSTGTYWATPQTELGESVESYSTGISSVSASLSDGGSTVFVDSWTLSGAMATIEGSVTYGTDAIETGVLVVATTGTITTTYPPTNDSDQRTQGQLLYTTSSKADGTYELEVRGGAGTYTIYAWYTKPDGTTLPKDSETADPAGGATVEDIDFSWTP